MHLNACITVCVCVCVCVYVCVCVGSVHIAICEAQLGVKHCHFAVQDPVYGVCCPCNSCGGCDGQQLVLNHHVAGCHVCI